jgi:Zn-finger protein
MSAAMCRNCGEPAGERHSLPVDETGEIVGVNYQGEWAGVPACEQCFHIHKACGNASDEIVRAVLKAYERATEELTIQLEAAREFVVEVRRTAGSLLEKIGEPGL